MPKMRPTSSDGGKQKYKQKRNFPYRTKDDWNQAIAEILKDQRHAKDPYSPAAPFAPPTPGVVVNNENAGNDIIAKIRAAQNKPQTEAKAAPRVMSPGAGLSGTAATSIMRAGGRPGRVSRLANDQSVPGIDTSLDVNTNGIDKRARNAAQLEYNPQIQAVQSLIGQTRSQSQRDQKDAEASYAALAAQMRSDVQPLNASFDSAQAQNQAIYQQLADQINQRYNQTADRNAAEFERLGIQDATPGATARQTTDRDFLASIAQLQGAGTNSVLETQQQGNVAALLKSAGLAGLTGANTGRDLRADLADKLLTLRQQKTSLVGSRAKSRRELMDQYTDEARAAAERDRAFGLDAQQFQESVRQNNIANAMADREFRTGREMDRANAALSAAKLQQDSAGQAAADFKSLDPQERAAAKAEQLVPGSGDKLFAGLQSLINSNPNIRRGFYTHLDASGREVRVNITPQQFGYIARRLAKKTGLPAGSIQKIAEAYWSEQ